LAEFKLKPKTGSVKPKTSFRQKRSKKEPRIDSRHNDHKPDEDKCISTFTPSNIFNIQHSSLWRMRRLEAWFKEQESYTDARYIESYSVEI